MKQPESRAYHRVEVKIHKPVYEELTRIAKKEGSTVSGVIAGMVEFHLRD